MNIFDISRKCSRHLQDDAFPDNRSFFLFLFSPKAEWYVFVNRIILHSVKKWQVVRAYSFENPKSTGTLAIVSIYFLNIIICWSWNVNVSIKLFVFFLVFLDKHVVKLVAQFILRFTEKVLINQLNRDHPSSLFISPLLSCSLIPSLSFHMWFHLRCFYLNQLLLLFSVVVTHLWCK